MSRAVWARLAAITGLILALPCARAQEKASSAALLEAVRAGDCQRIAALLDANPALTNANDMGVTALHAAAFEGQAAVVKLLLARHSDPNARSTKKQTPLHFAVLWGDATIVEFLLAAGASPDARDDADRTALDLAEKLGHEAIAVALTRTAARRSPEFGQALAAIATDDLDGLRLLLAAHPDVAKERRDQGVTLLHAAVRKLRPAYVDLLLMHGADPNATLGSSLAPLGVLALWLARQSETFPKAPKETYTGEPIAALVDEIALLAELFRLGQGGEGANDQDVYAFWPKVRAQQALGATSSAERRAVLDIVGSLCRWGADVRKAPLATYCAVAPLEIVRLLLERGADPLEIAPEAIEMASRLRNRCATFGAVSALNTAVVWHREDVVDLILGRLDEGTRARVARGALPFAAWSCSAGLVDRLVDLAGTNTIDRADLVQRAAQAANVEVLARFAARGWSVDREDSRGVTPLMEAAVGGDLKTAALILASGARVDLAMDDGFTSLNLAADRGNFEVVRALLDAGANVEAASRDGRRPLHSAATAGSMPIARLLIERGARVDSRDRQGGTPLLYAALRPGVALVRTLLLAGADVNAKVPDGNTALHIASGKGHIDVVRALLDARADVHAKSLGDTALHAAAHTGGPEVVAVLLASGVSPSAPNDRALTPLHFASDPRTIDLLVDAGAAIDALGGEGKMTPLACAIERGLEAVARRLFERGASPRIADVRGNTPARLARAKGMTGLANILER